MAPKDPYHLLAEIAQILKRLKIPYLVTGGIAVLIWGRPRFTADIDIVVELKALDIVPLAKNLKVLGKASYVDEDAMREALERHGEFNFIEAETGLKIDFWISNKNNDFDALRFKRIVYKKVAKERVAFISAEDLILKKLEWYRNSGSSRQLEDIESVLKISGKILDLSYLKRWSKKMGTFEIFKKLLEK